MQIDEALSARFRDWLAVKQYDELFSQGCCFHFAKRSFERGIGLLHCTLYEPNPDKADHVFVVVPDGRVFDRKGFRPAHDLLKERDSDPGYNRSATIGEVDDRIATMAIPQDLHRDILLAADELIDQLTAPNGGH